MAVARVGTLTDAGRQLGYSQSTVSQQLSQLEQLAGQRLVERTPGARTAALTPAGERLARHATAVLGRLGQARDELALSAPPLRIGAVPSAAAAFLSAMVGSVTEPVVLTESIRPDELLDELAAERLDFVLAATTDERAGVRRRIVHTDPYVLIVPDGHPLAGLGRPARPSDLAHVALIAKDCDTPSQRALDAALAAHGVAPSIRLRAHDARTVTQLVADGHGVAIIPRLLYQPRRHLTAIRADEIVPARRIALHAVSHRAHSPVEARLEAAIARVGGAQSAPRSGP